MADIDDDVIDLETDEAEQVEAEDVEQDAISGEAEDEDSDVIVFDGEAAPASGEAETGLVKNLRDQLRRIQKERDELRKTVPQQQAIVVGDKPTLAGCDYDEERHEAEFTAWQERKAKAEAQQREAEQGRQEAVEGWKREVEGHQAKKSALPFKDVQDAEDVAIAGLTDIQQQVIVRAADNSAMVMYALGKHPAKLAEISKITDPIKMAVAITKLEGKMSVTKRGGPPEPERIARGSASVNAGGDKELERLEKDADRTGDSSRLIAYRAKLKAQGRK